MVAASVYLKYMSLDEVESSMALSSGEWLHPCEQRELASLTHSQRRRQWLCGRWLAKLLLRQVAPAIATDFRALGIRSRDAAGRGMRPQVLFHERPQAWSLSLAHTDRAAVAGLGHATGVTVGVDLAPLQPLDSTFQRTWFTPRERIWLAAQSEADMRGVAAGHDAGDACAGPVIDLGPAVKKLTVAHGAVGLWALKEAVYKAVHRGEGFAPRRIEIRRGEAGNYAGTYGGMLLNHVCRLRAWELDGHVLALAERFEQAAAKGRWVPVLESPELKLAGN